MRPWGEFTTHRKSYNQPEESKQGPQGLRGGRGVVGRGDGGGPSKQEKPQGGGCLVTHLREGGEAGDRREGDFWCSLREHLHYVRTGEY